MYIIFIYNNISKRLERYSLEPYDDMPYTKNGSMFVSDFFGRSNSYIGWSSSEFLAAWDSVSYGKIRPCHVFCRIFEGGHIQHSMHYAGTAADCKEDFPYKDRNFLNFFPCFEKHKDCLHVSMQAEKFSEISVGDIGLFVLILQDSLNVLGFTGGELDGFFGLRTRDALAKFQKWNNLPATGTANAATWRALTFLAAGAGMTETTTHTKSKAHLNR